MNVLSLESRAKVVSLLCEGMSIRAIHRLTGTSTITIGTLILKLGQACQEYQSLQHRGLRCRRVEADEIWSFVKQKEQRVPQELKGLPGRGDLWTFLAICAESKLLISWTHGRRTLDKTAEFINDLSERIEGRFTLTTDQFSGYRSAVQCAFEGKPLDYAQVLKMMSPASGRIRPYIAGVEVRDVMGEPDLKRARTTTVERVNLSIRQSNRRFGRETAAHSKRPEHHAAMFSLYSMHYNYVRPHMSLKTTPAVTAGLCSRPWAAADMVQLLETRAEYTAKEPGLSCWTNGVDPIYVSTHLARLEAKWSNL